MKIKNKEYGSDFHYLIDNEGAQSIFDYENIHFFFSGRSALLNLLKLGVSRYGWKKVGFPSYYCHEVVTFCKSLPCEIVYYGYNPYQNNIIDWEDEPENVFILVDFFGVKKADISFLQNSVIIEDVTHNITGFTESKADYCFGSLRKQLPVPVGGFCFSRKNKLKFDIPVTDVAEEAALQKLTAMFLKRKYLKGELASKDLFRQLYTEAEEMFQSPQSNSLLPQPVKLQVLSLPGLSLINRTRENIAMAKKALVLSPDYELLQNPSDSEMGLVLICNNQYIRDGLKTHLVSHNIFPAILWPGQFTDLNKNLENRLLFIHLDFRYDKEDIDYIVNTINNFFINV